MYADASTPANHVLRPTSKTSIGVCGVQVHPRQRFPHREQDRCGVEHHRAGRVGGQPAQPEVDLLERDRTVEFAYLQGKDGQQSWTEMLGGSTRIPVEAKLKHACVSNCGERPLNHVGRCDAGFRASSNHRPWPPNESPPWTRGAGCPETSAASSSALVSDYSAGGRAVDEPESTSRCSATIFRCAFARRQR